MSKTGKIIVGLIAIIIVIIILSFSSTKSSSETIKIGYFGPFTGPVAGTSGEDVGNGWKLAVKERNILAGKKVEVIYEDDACDPKKAVAAANKLISIDKTSIIVNGVCSGSMVSAMPLAENAKVILFTAVSTSPKITTGGDYIFRTSGTSVQTAKAMADFIQKHNYKTISILFENAEYSVSLKDSFVKSIASSSINILNQEGINSQEPDIRTPLTKIASAKPQALVVIMNSTVTVSSFVKQNKELGLKIPVVGNEYFAFSNVVTNPDASGMYSTRYQYNSESPKLLAFLDSYKKLYGKSPSQDIYAAQAFDGYNILADAIEKCGNANSDCAKDNLYKVRDYAGITGNITIDSNGDTERVFTILQIKDGKLNDPQ